MSDFLFTSESVSEGHPDKVADQISDAVLDAILAQDKHGRVAAETLVATGLVVMAGQITTSANFGHTVGKPVVYGYLPVELLDRHEFTIEVYGEPIPALRHDRPVYDPTSARLKA